MKPLPLAACLAVTAFTLTGCDSVTVVEHHRDYRPAGYYGDGYYAHHRDYDDGYYRRPSSTTVVVGPSYDRYNRDVYVANGTRSNYSYGHSGYAYSRSAYNTRNTAAYNTRNTVVVVDDKKKKKHHDHDHD